MVTMDQIINGTMAYYEAEIAQKATGVGKFAAYFALPSIPKIIRSKADTLRASPLTADLINADGLVDLEAVKERATQAMQHCGSVDVMGFRLGQADIDQLYNAIRRA